MIDVPYHFKTSKESSVKLNGTFQGHIAISHESSLSLTTNPLSVSGFSFVSREHHLRL